MHNLHGILHGVAEAGEPALVITVTGAAGRASLGRLEASHGPLAHDTGEGLAWASRKFGDLAEARLFALSPDLAERAGAGFYLAAGLAVATARVDSADLTLEGPGAAWLVALSQPGMRNHGRSLPELPLAWARALSSGGVSVAEGVAARPTAQRGQP